MTTDPRGKAEPETLLRLRPFVHVSPTSSGIHVRGWAAAFTIDGGAGLWRLWQRLAPVLAEGVSPAQLDAMIGRPTTHDVVRLVVEQLRIHDMLVGVPAAWAAGPTGSTMPPAAVAAWLEAVAADPTQAWRRVSRASVAVDGGGPLADAAARALAATGLRAAPPRSAAGRAGTGRRPGIVRLVADTTAVAAGAGSRRGFVTPPAGPDSVTHDAIRIAGRVVPDALDDPPHTLTALVAGAAAHRLVCAVAGLRDPGQEAALLGAEGPGRVTGAWPRVFVARAAPLAAAYHPWLLGAARLSPPDTETLDGALDRLGAVCDPELGVLPPPEPGDLPQLPAALAACRPATGEVIGIGASLDAARLDAALRAAALVLSQADAPGEREERSGAESRSASERWLCEREERSGAESRSASERWLGGWGGLAVGADRRHADGVLLRRAVTDLSSCRGPAVPERAWAADPVARRWWKALRLRFAVRAESTVECLADGVFLARIRSGNTWLSAAVEATPGHAVAFAALIATATVQARRAGLAVDDGPQTSMCGGMPAPTPLYGVSGPWSAEPWTWPATRPAEERLQAALRSLLPPERHPEPLRSSGDSDLLEALTAAGFAVARSTGATGVDG